MPHLSEFDLIRLLKALGLVRSTPNDGQLVPAPRPVALLTSPTFIVPPNTPCGTLFTNRGLGGASAVTLPAVTAVPVGTWYWFVGIVAQNIVVATATPDTLVALNDVAADSIAIQTAGQIIGALLKVINDGTQWIAVGETVGATYTIVTD